MQCEKGRDYQDCLTDKSFKLGDYGLFEVTKYCTVCSMGYTCFLEYTVQNSKIIIFHNTSG